ncbi:MULTISPECIES: hypothetical protein [unclassified Mucilaginibacter]|uniref:hypothetical protein n=1 Tax=unclassified Mucilaginibacter TaxID=2617802 RepID=UPI002AC98CB8|nr:MULTISPECIES: hypothetical protein [unclassified Mucilaginibacter]MEB0260229.1 hypothetical protein [Mucilaginibacter sp. 10I4]MEB0277360.1 hypothetical protein [Mucilaginibacter sp. 10B2]MEB0300158.1 hypothetical protein [Mucilaginibacter sp. 5C4]WPX25484.1 hypothetical protein RHM67_09425 [Mucilaginibacter sp. 5C4]
MKRLIVITLILIAATAYITVKYFKNLNTSGMHAGNIMRTIPDGAALVFEFTNEKSFYDIYNGNTLLHNLMGEDKMNELDTVRNVLFNNAALSSFFTGRNVFVSVHPSQSTQVDLLLTASTAKDIDLNEFDKLAKQQKTGMLITPLKIGEKRGYNIYFNSLKKRFYIINIDANIYSGSFSKDLITQTANYKPDRDKHAFMLLPDQQNSNSLANLYINYEHLGPLFNQLFQNSNTDIFKPFRLLPALAALNLNFKNDAVMFSGYTNIETQRPGTYLNVFTNQQPVVNELKDLYPYTTAYATNFAVSDPARFATDLSDFQNKAGLQKEKDALFSKIKAETGINLNAEFAKLLGNEFAVATTRYQEKLAIVTVKNGSKLRPFMTNISTMARDDVGQFNYNKLPFFLLGDAFNAFKKPYFRIIDNYLILANSTKELESYNDIYLNRKFLNKTEQYVKFDNLLAEKSNVAFFIHFKNAQQILKDGLKDEFYLAYKNNSLSIKNFYGASYQFAATDKNFYTNFCLLQNQPDSTVSKKNN